MYRKERWSSETILDVWEKGKIVGDNDPKVFRKDACGAWMQFSKHGDRDAKYGWAIAQKKRNISAIPFHF